MSDTASIPTLPPEVMAEQQVFRAATGYMVSTALHVAVNLRIPDLVGSGPQSAADLARQTATNEDALYRVLRLLASVGIFEEADGRRFLSNLASERLRSDLPGTMFDMALWIAEPTHYRIYAEAMHSVRTGQPAVEKALGVPVFELFPRHPELSEIFNNAMTAFSASVVPAVLEAYDFSGIGTLVDVAGGHGMVLTSILAAYPAMQGVLFDLPHVIAGAVPRIRDRGLADRCRAIPGDFFESVPEGGDAYIMKHIIHDWDDDRAERILGNIRSAMRPGGRVILVDSVLLPPNEPDFGKLIDIEMLLLPGGRERTAAEFSALFARAGFRLTAIVPTRSPLSVIEAR